MGHRKPDHPGPGTSTNAPGDPGAGPSHEPRVSLRLTSGQKPRGSEDRLQSEVEYQFGLIVRAERATGSHGEPGTMILFKRARRRSAKPFRSMVRQSETTAGCTLTSVPTSIDNVSQSKLPKIAFRTRSRHRQLGKRVIVSCHLASYHPRSFPAPRHPTSRFDDRAESVRHLHRRRL